MPDRLWLFSYGTLRQPDVQRALFGREVETVDDTLFGFTIGSVTIADPAVIEKSGSDRHPILMQGAADNVVQGSALLLSKVDLDIADRYESDDYVRISVKLASGRDAFAYVQRDADVSLTADRIVLVTPDADLRQRLLPAARRIFTETFGDLYDRAAFEAFCDAVYLPGGSMDHDLRSPEVRWRVAIRDSEPIGYAKLTPLHAPAADPAPGAMELQQIYVQSDWQGAGVANALMAWVVGTAREHRVPELYLTVFDHNERAKRFYTRHQFEEVGRCTFRLGERIDDDRIWRRRLRGD